MPNDTKTVLKLNGSRSYGVIIPAVSLDLNVIEVVLDHLNGTKSSQHPKRSFGMSFKKPEKTIPGD